MIGHAKKARAVGMWQDGMGLRTFRRPGTVEVSPQGSTIDVQLTTVCPHRLER